MRRAGFLRDLDEYARTWGAGELGYPGLDRAEERALAPLFRDFVGTHADCFERSCAPGHVTGSALVVSPDLSRVLLTLHGKLDLWLQLGGHADGDPEPHGVAMREAEEESGLAGLTFFRAAGTMSGGRPLPFDLDRHLIPARKDEPAHHHYDVRYLIVADPRAPLGITEESKDLQWFALDEARSVTDERSMHRQFDKVAWLRLTGRSETLS